MTSELPFEYTSRWPEIKAIIESGDMELAKQALEDRDRKLEEFLNRPSGGGTAQSIIAVYNDTYSYDGTDGPTIAHNLITDVVIPADASFTYYVDWQIGGNITASVNDGDAVAVLGNGKVNEWVPGTGFEAFWGYRNAINAGTAQFPSYGNGAGGRIEEVPEAFLGTTAHFYHECAHENYGHISISTRYRTSIRLLAVPN